MDIFKAGEGRIKYITLNNDTIKRSADRKVGRAFLYIYMCIWLSQKTVQYCTNRTNAGGAGLCACTVFVMMYGLDVSQFPTVFQQEVEQGLVFHWNHKIKKEK